MFIGRIVSENQLQKRINLQYIEYSTEYIEDLSIPTLIVGYKLAKSLYKINNLNREIIKNKLYWVYNESEDVIEFNTGIEKFLSSVFDLYFSDVKYYSCDIFFNSNKILDEHPFENIFQISNKLFLIKENLILSIHLNHFKFFKMEFNVDNFIKTVSPNYYIDNGFKYYRKLLQKDYPKEILNRYIGYLHYSEFFLKNKYL